MRTKLPGEHLFSRAFAEFTQVGLMQQAHEDLIKQHLSGQLVGHIARDSTAIEGREKPAKKAAAPPPAKRGRPRRRSVRRRRRRASSGRWLE